MSSNDTKSSRWLRFRLQQQTKRRLAVTAVCVLLYVFAIWKLFIRPVMCTQAAPEMWDAFAQSDGPMVPETLDVVVVLGYAAHGGVLDPGLVARLESALHYVRRGLTTNILLTGGRDDGDNFSEAQYMAMWLIDHACEFHSGDVNQSYSGGEDHGDYARSIHTRDGSEGVSEGNGTRESGYCGFPGKERPVVNPDTEVVEGAIPGVTLWLENVSTSTRTNACYSVPFFLNNEWASALLVTSPFHGLRSRLTFSNVLPDVKFYMAKAQVANPAIQNFDLVRELLAMALYYVRGWL